jgi:hypothetical protein
MPLDVLTRLDRAYWRDVDRQMARWEVTQGRFRCICWRFYLSPVSVLRRINPADLTPAEATAYELVRRSLKGDVDCILRFWKLLDGRKHSIPQRIRALEKKRLRHERRPNQAPSATSRARPAGALRRTERVGD